MLHLPYVLSYSFVSMRATGARWSAGNEVNEYSERVLIRVMNSRSLKLYAW